MAKEPMIVGVIDEPVDDEMKPSAVSEDIQPAPGVLPGNPVGSAARAGALSLMRVTTSSEDLDKKLIMLKLAVFEHEGEASKKMAKIKRDWIKKIMKLEDLEEIEDKEKKKLATMLFDDFISFVFSRENLHKNSDDLRAMLKKLSEVESAREAFFGINGLPAGFISKFFSSDSPVFGMMSQIIELYNDDSFRNSMKRYVDEAFSAEMSTPESGIDQDKADAPDGSLLSSRQDMA
jgi:hypothetical protein